MHSTRFFLGGLCCHAGMACIYVSDTIPHAAITHAISCLVSLTWITVERRGQETTPYKWRLPPPLIIIIYTYKEGSPKKVYIYHGILNCLLTTASLTIREGNESGGISHCSPPPTAWYRLMTACITPNISCLSASSACKSCCLQCVVRLSTPNSSA